MSRNGLSTKRDFQQGFVLLTFQSPRLPFLHFYDYHLIYSNPSSLIFLLNPFLPWDLISGAPTCSTSSLNAPLLLDLRETWLFPWCDHFPWRALKGSLSLLCHVSWGPKEKGSPLLPHSSFKINFFSPSWSKSRFSEDHTISSCLVLCAINFKPFDSIRNSVMLRLIAHCLPLHHHSYKHLQNFVSMWLMRQP